MNRSRLINRIGLGIFLALFSAVALSQQVSIPPFGAGQIPGTIASDNAIAGNVGEYIEGTLAIGSATSLVTATAKTIISISLTAGDWDVSGTIYFTPDTTTNVTQYAASSSLTTDTLDIAPFAFQSIAYPAGIPGIRITAPQIPMRRFSLSVTTTIFAIAQSAFTVSTMTAWGGIRARRVR